jgi:lipoprotein-anchoring transpeptidase ErfK/SrfK
MRCAAALSILLAAIALPAPAVAVEQVERPAPAPVAPPAPAAPSATQPQLALTFERVGDDRTVLRRQRIRVRGATAAFVPGEMITLRFFSSGREVGAMQVMLKPGAQGGGAFRVSYRPDHYGPLVVHASHAATPALGELLASGEVDVLPRRVGPGSRRGAVRVLQRRLARLGYVVSEHGVYDARTARAVLAFRKVTGMARRFSASRGVMSAIARGAGRFKIRRPSHGRHIEADLSRQVIALIDGGRVRRIYPISSGKPSTPTVTGSFRVYLKRFGTNIKGMVHSAYFIRGYATHGYPSVPVYPASHGCLRVPLRDALSLFRWIRIGTPIDVYR